MPVNVWKSLTMQFMALGHSLHEAKCIAAVIVIDCLVISTIMGYHFSDAEGERSPATCHSRPEIRPMTAAGHCGTVPERVDRDGDLLHCQLNPAGPGCRQERSEIADLRGISSAARQDAAMVRW
ncbi:MAG: hypothetical protein WC379_14955 [Methanoregula sp.]|jgi:hypothetical protein